MAKLFAIAGLSWAALRVHCAGTDRCRRGGRHVAPPASLKVIGCKRRHALLPTLNM